MLVILVVLWIATLSLSVSRPVAADLPEVIPGADASRTIRWTMNRSQGLTLQDIELSSGAAKLPWTYTNISWPDGEGFSLNGTMDANLTLASNGIELAADPTNHIANGAFVANTNWSFENGLGGNISAAWDPVGRNAVLRSASPTTENLWNGMNSTSGWVFQGSFNITATPRLNTTAPREGTGMLEIDISDVFDSDSHYVGFARAGSVDWSGVDRLVLWVYLNKSDAVTFRVTAVNATNAPVGTSPQAMATGWQQVAVNLRELGPDRAALSAVTLRFDGVFSPPEYFLLDDARTGVSREYADSAAVSQAIFKSTTTSPTLGSAVLTLNWTATSVTNVTQLLLDMNVSGQLGTFDRVVPISAAVPWQRLTADVSSIMSSSDTYHVRFEVHVAANTTGPINATVLIDDVGLVIPNRHDGTYVSNVLALGLESDLLSLYWRATVPASTSINFGIHSGNTSDPANGGWSDWQTWTVPGSYRPAAGGSSRVQVRAVLQTTNSSVSPTLLSMVLETRHRAAQGSIVSEPYVAASDFLWWRTIDISSTAAPGTSVELFVGNGSYWMRVASGSNLTGYGGRTIQWRVLFSTSNGLQTPSLTQIELVYEYLGPIVRVVISPDGPLTVVSGDTIHFRAVALDAGSHVNPSAVFVWVTNDGGQIVDGEYRATKAGQWNVTATVAGLGVSARVQVRVVAAPPAFLADIGPLAIVLALGIGGAYGGYAIVVRRMFAIDDIFLISKDGRLMLHNTRRMRADRDEDILSAMLTAILTFLRDFDPEENGELRRFDIGGKTALLERGAHVYLAAVYSGRVPRWAGKDLRRFMSNLETRFGPTFAHWTGSPQDLQGLKAFSEKFVSRVRYRPGRGARRQAG